MRFYRDPITNFWGNKAHFSYFWFLIVKKAQLNPTLYEHHKLFMNNWSLPSISKFFWFDISHALSNKGPAKRTQHFNAKSFNIVTRKRVAHFWPRLAHVWHTFGHPTATCYNMLDGFGSSSGYCKMLHTLGQLLYNISQHDPTLLQDVTLKCCVRLSCLVHFYFVFWISFQMNIL